MQIRSTIAFYNHKVPIILKKNSHSVMVNHGKTTKYFPGLSRTYQQKSRTFKDFPGQQKKSKTFPGCGNPESSMCAWTLLRYRFFQSRDNTKLRLVGHTRKINGYHFHLSFFATFCCGRVRMSWYDL